MLTENRPRPCAVWQLGHPVWQCGFRPFFILATLCAPLCIGLWVALLVAGLPVSHVAGGGLVWHAHELLFGFSLAAVAGFVLTGVPEFTQSAAFPPRVVRPLVACWLVGRIAFWSSGWGGALALSVAALAHLGVVAGLAWLVAPRLWADAQRKHLAFLWGLVALGLCVLGFYADALRGVYPGRWLYAALGVLMVLVVVAMSRISMRIVNSAIEETGVQGVEYLARPPRRNLVIGLIGLYTLAELAGSAARLQGWLALAAAAAVFHLLNDWHIGRALFRRWAFMLYGVYVLMALGYATMGVSLVTGAGAFSAGRHLLTVGVLGLSIFAVLCIAGRTHCGVLPDERTWLPVAAGMLVLAALVRAAVALPGAGDARGWWLGSGLLWCGAFLMYAWHMLPLLFSARTDAGAGCDGAGEPA